MPTKIYSTWSNYQSIFTKKGNCSDVKQLPYTIYTFSVFFSNSLNKIFQILHIICHILIRHLIVGQIARKITIVRCHID